MSCNPLFGHDPSNIVKMVTRRIDEMDSNSRSEVVKVCKSCQCYVLDDYSAAQAKRAIAGTQKHIHLFEGSHL